MRLVGGAALLAHGIYLMPGVRGILPILAGILLFLGLWTPISGSIAAALELWTALSRPVDPWVYILSATMAAALAMIGPGMWSVDARLFGWKRIDLGRR
jgi:hypothetical protein